MLAWSRYRPQVATAHAPKRRARGGGRAASRGLSARVLGSGPLDPAVQASIRMWPRSLALDLPAGPTTFTLWLRPFAPPTPGVSAWQAAGAELATPGRWLAASASPSPRVQVWSDCCPRAGALRCYATLLQRGFNLTQTPLAALSQTNFWKYLGLYYFAVGGRCRLLHECFAGHLNDFFFPQKRETFSPPGVPILIFHDRSW